jgi:hypothetical protein
MRKALALSVLIALSCANASAETHRFVPTTYYNTFSFAHPPALRIKSGDQAPRNKEAVSTATPGSFGGNMDYAGMGQAVEYEIANVVDPHFTVVAKLRKAHLPRR